MSAENGKKEMHLRIYKSELETLQPTDKASGYRDWLLT